MDKEIRKKLKIVLIAFAIVIIPLGYIVAISFAIMIHDDALEKAMILFPDDKSVIRKSIDDMDKAIMIYPWNHSFHMDKAQLQMKLNDYRGALISAKNGIDLKNYAEGLEYIGMIYEFLNQPDSASIYYSKAIDILKERLIKTNNNATNMELGLLYSFVGDSIKARQHLKVASNDGEPYWKQVYDRYDYYIENYRSGGLKDYLYGETIEMTIDSTLDKNQVDSLINDSRFYYDSQSEWIKVNKIQTVYRIKKIFKNKAESIGFIEARE